MSTANQPMKVMAPLAGMHPASFALVMATGIVSVAAEFGGMSSIAWALLWMNVVFYAALCVLTLARAVRYGAQVCADLCDHSRAVGFFTIVAATCVLGNQFVVVANRPQVALAFWAAGIVLWAIIIYSIFTILTVQTNKPDLGEGLNGGWLVAVVAAQSVAALGGLVSPELSQGREMALFFSLVMWLGGGMLYIWIIVLVFYRYTFLPLDPRQLAPPYWINMGAMAISTLAGVILVDAAELSPLLTRLLPFLMGMTLLFWATATWWIPLLVALGAWRHVVRRVPVHYDVVYWSAVFPLGMYAVCTHRLVRVFELPFLEFIPRCFTIIALAAWALTMSGFIRRLWKSLSAPKAVES